MDVRLGDLYDLIVRIVDDRLKQRSETDHLLQTRGTETPFAGSHEWSPEEEKTLLLTLSGQITNLINLQRQLLETVQAGQRRVETLLSELLDLLKQQVEVSRTSNGRRLAQPPTEEGKPSEERGHEKDIGSKKSHELRPNTRSDEPYETSSTMGYTAMSPPDLSDEEITFVPSDNWLKESSPQSSADELSPDGAHTSTVSASSSQMDILTDQLADYLRRLFGIEVDYLQVRQTPSSPSIQDAQVLVGEGTHNDQLVTLTVFGKSHITPTDVTIFYNAIVRPLRGSVAEPVMSIIFGETFEPKALKVAHALDLLVVNLKDLREISGSEV